MKKRATKNWYRSERNRERELDAVLTANARQFSIRAPDDPFTPVLHCHKCGLETCHCFPKKGREVVKHYSAGAAQGIPKYGKGGSPIEMEIDVWQCSKCQTERVYGSA